MNKTPNMANPEIGSGGIRCRLSPFGAAIVRLQVRIKGGEYRDVAFPLADRDDPENDPSLAGRIVGPVCGRVRDGEICAGSNTIRLERNENGNHLHGGSTGASIQCWQLERAGEATATFSLDLPDGLCGFPGNRHLTAEYTAEPDALLLVLRAVTDKPTPMDLTNHTYWDLSGRFDGSAMHQRLFSDAETVVRNRADHVPQEITRTGGTAFDFRKPSSFEQKMAENPNEEQLKIALGLNNALIFGAGRTLTLTAPDESLQMRMETNAPSAVVYTGGFLDGQTRLLGGGAVPGCGVALEAQEIPDAFHIAPDRARLLQPGEVFERRIRWSFN